MRFWSMLCVGLVALGQISSSATDIQQIGALPSNVLVIMGDDHAAYALGCYGSRLAKTPNLDRLASEGARFTRAYCNSPVCTPSRQSLLTGRMPHAVGVTQLSTALSDQELTLAEHLKTAGYATGAIGKMHFNSQKKHGFDTRLDSPDHNTFIRQNPPAPLPAGTRTLGPWKPFQDPARVWLNADCLPFPARAADMDAAYFARHAAEFLKSPRQQPFYLVVSFTQPHSPFRFPVEYAGRIKPAEMPVPTVGSEDGPRVPLIFRGMGEHDTRGINAAYYTAVEYLDSQVGEVLRALDASGQAGNTLVVYLGDHGYNLGHHGCFEKHRFNEEAVRVPLLVRWPGKIRPGTRVDSFAELVDLFPSISDACGVPLPPERRGRSLLPLLQGAPAPADWRDAVVSVYHENEEAMIRTERWKLIYCSGKRERNDGYKTENPTPGRSVRLYDLQSDPGEVRDVSSLPANADRLADLKRRLLARLAATSHAGVSAPPGLSVEDALDWHLVPVEVRLATRP